MAKLFTVLLALILWLPLIGADQVQDLELSSGQLIPKNYLQRLDEIKKIIEVNCLSFKLGASFDGRLAMREVPYGAKVNQSLSSNNISLNSRFAYGVYPTEAEFNTNLTFEYVDNEIAQTTSFQETMSSFLFNVEQYFAPNWEGYGFIERFSNSYMGVDQRWEIGCGMKWEGEQLTSNRKGKWQAMESNQDILSFLDILLAILEGKDVCRMVIAGNDYFKMAASLVASGCHGKPSESIEQICKDIRAYRELLKLFNTENKKGKLRVAWTKRHANIQFDLAGSFLVDITHPSLSYTVLSQNELGTPWNSTVGKKQFDPESKLRISLRAGAVLRPSDNVEISSKWYFKLPLTSTYVDFVGGKKYDLRIDSFSSIMYKIPIGKGTSKILIGMQLEYLYDNISPFLDPLTRKAITDQLDNTEDAKALGIKHYIDNFLGPKFYTSLKATVGWEL